MCLGCTSCLCSHWQFFCNRNRPHVLTEQSKNEQTRMGGGNVRVTGTNVKRPGGLQDYQIMFSHFIVCKILLDNSAQHLPIPSMCGLFSDRNKSNTFQIDRQTDTSSSLTSLSTTTLDVCPPFRNKFSSGGANGSKHRGRGLPEGWREWITIK